MKLSKWRLFLILSIVAFLVMGTGKFYPVGAQTKPAPVKIGGLLTLTGTMSLTGQYLRNAMELAAEIINEQGGIKSLGGAKVQMVYGDSQAKPNVAVSETERLIVKENVVALVDQYPSACSIAATSVAERLKTPFVVAVSYAEPITERGHYYTFMLEPTVAEVGAFRCQFIDWLGQKMGRKLTRVGHLYEDTDWGQSLGKAQREYLKKNGYEMVADFSYARPLSDASSLMAKVKAAKPDFVITQAYVTENILFIKTAHRYDLWNVPWLFGGTALQPATLQAVKEQGEGLTDHNQWYFDISKEARAFNERYRAKYKEDMDGVSALMYQGVWIVKEGLEKAGKVDRKALADALHTIKMEPGYPAMILPYDFISFDKKGENKGGRFTFAQVQNQRWVTVYPEKYAGGKLVIPDSWKKR